MPRRQKRFSFLERALKASGGTATQGVLFNYQQFKAGINKANSPATINPDTRKSVGYGLLPFGIDKPATPVPANYYKIRISVFSNTWRATPLPNAAIGYVNGADYAGSTSSGGFYPAVAKIFIPTAASVDTISGITKVSYKKRVGSAYSVPFGTHAADAPRSSEFEQQAAITAALGALPPIGGKSISFLPEQLVKVRAEPSAGA